MSRPPDAECYAFDHSLPTRQHPGGFVLTLDRLDELVPAEPAAMDHRQVIEWDKDDIDALKFMKVDVLGLGMLGCMRRAFDLLDGRRARASTLRRSHRKTPHLRHDLQGGHHGHISPKCRCCRASSRRRFMT